jgi:endonuclease III
MLLTAKVFVHATEKEGCNALRMDWEFQLLHKLKLTYLDDGNGPAPSVQQRAVAMLACIIVSSAANDRAAIDGIVKLDRAGILSAEGLKRASIDLITECIYSIGIENNKAQYLKDMGTTIVDDYNGFVPETVMQLCKLKGVSTKTARLIVAEVFGIVCGIACDAHVINATNALGLIAKRHTEANHVDLALRTFIPGNFFRWVNMVFGSLGQLFTQMIPLSYDLDFFSLDLDMEEAVEEANVDHITVVDIVRRVRRVLVSHFREPREQEMMCFIIQRLRVYYRTTNTPTNVGPVSNNDDADVVGPVPGPL